MLYESAIQPITILSTLPSAGIGALLTLIVFGFNLDVIGLIGIILLIGIVKKNGIMLIGSKRAAVALARKLAVVLHVLWKTRKNFDPNHRLAA